MRTVHRRVLVVGVLVGCGAALGAAVVGRSVQADAAPLLLLSTLGGAAVGAAVGWLGGAWVADSVRRAVAEARRMRSDLEAAREVQEALCSPWDPSSERFDVAAWFQPAAVTGGDWYAWFPDGDDLHLLVGDVTGHGTGPALLAASARSAASVLVRTGAIRPSALLHALNRELLSIARGRRQMTCAALLLDRSTGTLRYALAAHPRPVILGPAGGVRSLDGAGPPLGDAPDARFTEGETRLEPGETLFVYTDGLVDACDARGRPLGRRRLVALLEAAAEAPDAKAMGERLRAGLAAQLGPAWSPERLVDDVTFLIVRAML